MLTLSVNPGGEDLLKQYSGEHGHHLTSCPVVRLSQCVYTDSGILHMMGQAPHEVGRAYLPDAWTASRFGLRVSESCAVCRATLALNQTGNSWWWVSRVRENFLR